MPMTVPRKAVPVYIVTILYAALIFHLSSMDSPKGTGDWGGILADLFQDKTNHIIEYFILGVLLYVCFHLTPLSYDKFPTKLDTPHKKRSAATLLLGTFYGVTDEIHQLFVPGRNSSVIDVMADALGVLIAVLLMPTLMRQYRRFREISGTGGEVRVGMENAGRGENEEGGMGSGKGNVPAEGGGIPEVQMGGETGGPDEDPMARGGGKS